MTWLVACLVAVAALGEQHWHLGERSWLSKGAPDTMVLVEGQLIQHEWWIHLLPVLWANGEPLPAVTDTAHLYRFFPPYLHALAWALTGSAVRGLVLLTDVFWAGAALATMALAGQATRSAVGGALAGLLVAMSPGFLGMQWHIPHLGAFFLVPLFWLVVERSLPYRAAAPWRRAALVGVLLGVGGLTYDLHLPLLAWLLLAEGPRVLMGAPRARRAGLTRLAVTLLSLGAVLLGWMWLGEHVLVDRVEGLNDSAPAVRRSLEQLQALGPLPFIAQRAATLLELLTRAHTMPVLGAAAAGVLALPRRWVVRSLLLVAVFSAAAVLTKSEARVLVPAQAGVCLLAAGAVVGAGRAFGRLLGEPHDGRLQGLLAVLLLGATFLFTHGELWGDYAVLRAW